MNKLKSSAIALITGVTLMTASSATFAMDPDIENALIDTCKTALKDNTRRFKQTLDGYNLKMKTVALKVMCNGDDIVAFAEKRGANRVAERLHDSVGNVDITDVAKLEKMSVYFEE